MIGTLFVLLQQALTSGGFTADTMLTRLIQQDQDLISIFHIATTCIPDFSKHIQNPSHGFHHLCFLSTVNAEYQSVPQTLHPSHELLASDPWSNNQEVMCFAQLFQPMGIELNTHFNVISYPTQRSLPMLLHGLSTPSESSLSRSDSASAVQSCGSSPQVVVPPLQSGYDPAQLHHSPHVAPPLHQLQPPPNPSFHGSMHMAAPFAPIQDPSLLFNSAVYPATPHSFSLLPSPQPQPQPQLLALLPSSPPANQTSLSCSIPDSESDAQDNVVMQSLPSEVSYPRSSKKGELIKHLLIHHTISTDQTEAAIFNKSLQGLCIKVWNFNAMGLILNRLGFLLPFHVGVDPTVTFSDVAVRASDVLQHFGWAPHSFEHKAGWYATAKALSERKWKGSVPGK